MKLNYHTNKKSRYLKYFYPIAVLTFSILTICSYAHGMKNNVYYSLLVFVLIFLMKNKIARNIFVILTAIMPILYYPTSLLYGPVTLDLVTALLLTDSSEASGFISTIPAFYFVPSLSILLSAVIIVISPTPDYINLKAKWYYFILIVGIVTPEIYFGVTRPQERFKVYHTPHLTFIYKFMNYYEIIKKEEVFLRNSIAGKTDWNPSLTDKLTDNIVIIIGESARCDKMSVCGFKEMENTPFLSSSNGVVFTNYHSAGPNTVTSLKRTLYFTDPADISRQPQFNNSLVNLFKESGYKVNWISNQGILGVHDTSNTISAKQSNKSYFLKAETTPPYVDVKLLPKVIDAINTASTNKTPTVTFVHLNGSHNNACDRLIDEQFNEFYRSKTVSCYMQTLKNTDKLINDIYLELGQLKGDYKLIYFSDHGQSTFFKDTDKEYYGHHAGKKSGYSAPFFIVTNEDKDRTVVKEERSGFQLMKILASAANIKDPKLVQQCEYLKNVKCNGDKEDYVIVNDKRVLYSTLSDEE